MEPKPWWGERDIAYSLLKKVYTPLGLLLSLLYLYTPLGSFSF